MIRSSEAIVLKSFDFRETSRIATFFTKDQGKIKGILKGIRKDPKKFGSNLDQFSVNDIVYYWHRNSEIHLVGQCDLHQFFLPVRQDLKKTYAASYILELINAIMPLEEKNSEVYKMIKDFLTSLETTEDISKLVHMFQIKILILSGFRPHIDSCLRCQEKIEGKARFSLQSGGLFCLKCKSEDSTLVPISQGTVASVLHIERNSWEKCLRLGLTASVKKELKYVLNNFLVFHLERNLKSAKYL